MSAGLVARRYAKALYKAVGSDLTKAESLMESLEMIEALFQNKDAGSILKSPTMPRDLKLSLLNYALDKANAPRDVRGFCDEIIEAGRVPLLPEIVAVFRQLLNEAAGIVDASVHSAVALSDAELSAIKTKIAGIVGKDVRLHADLDQSLLGGFVVKVGNFKIDMSLKTKIGELAQQAATSQ